VKLGTLLLRDAVLNLSQLEAALRAQVIYGGKLGTNLIELNFIDLDTLGMYLSRVLEVPLATQEQFENVDASVLDALGAGLADVYTAIPLGYEDEAGTTLAVALAEPTNRHTLEKLEVQCGLKISAYVSPELRLLYYLEKYYHISRKARFVRTGTRKASPNYLDDRRRTQPPGGVESPPAVLLVPKKNGRSHTDSGSHDAVQLSYDDACQAIDGADDRDSIADTFMEFARGRFGAAVMFLLRDQNALGWRVYSEDSSGMEVGVEELSLALGGSSSLQIANDTMKMFRGTSPSAGKPVERRLWEAIGTTSEPDELMVMPLAVSQRVINLFYAHPKEGKFDSDLVDQTLDLASRAGKAYARLIRESRDGTRHSRE
jgi:hypothetical protein